MKRVSIALFGILLALAVAPMCAFADEGDLVPDNTLNSDTPIKQSDDPSSGGVTDQVGYPANDSSGDLSADPQSSNDGSTLPPDDAADDAVTPTEDGNNDEVLLPPSEDESTPSLAEGEAATGQAPSDSKTDTNKEADTKSTSDIAKTEGASQVATATKVAANAQTAKAAEMGTAPTATAPKKATTAKTTAQKPAVKSTKAPSGVNSSDPLIDGMVYRISTQYAAKDKKVLDIHGGSTSSGANIEIFDAHNGLNQYWRAVHQGNGVYRFVSYKGDNMLGVTGKLIKTANVANLKSGNVDWKVYKNSDGTFSLAPAKATKLRLDLGNGSTANGNNIWLWEKNGGKAQNFFFVQQKGLAEAYKAGKSVAPATVEITLADNAGLAFGIANATKDNGGNLQVEKVNKTKSQKFKLMYLGNGLYEIVNSNSGKLLDVVEASTKDGANVTQFQRNSGIHQYWFFERSGQSYKIKSALTGYALGPDKAQNKSNVHINKNSKQLYKISEKPIVEDGIYVVSSALVSALVLDVNNGSTKSGANVELFRSHGGKNQQFKFTHLGGGIYTIMGVASGNYLEVKGSSKAAGANIQMFKENNANNQKWRIEEGPYGYMFKSVATGMYMDVHESKRQFGTNIEQFTGTKNQNQCWDLHDEKWSFYPSNTNLNDMKVMTKAEEYEGWPYHWGGRKPSTSFDCAGLVMYCSNQVWGTNFDLIMTNADRLYSLCTPISESQAKVGDLVFYRGTYGSNINYISHVVFYAGRGVMYGAGDPIGYAKVDSIRNIRKQKAVYMYARIRH